MKKHIESLLRRVRPLLLAVGLLLSAVAQSQVREYQLKSVFLLNFTQFVEWPPSAFGSPSAPFVIGVLGNDPFGSFLDETVRDETVQGHPIVVQRYASLRELRACHLLFVAANIHDLSGLSGQALLTVGESPDFNKSGGMIQFYSENNRVRFQVRPGMVRAAHLSISSKLLRLAKIVD